MAPEICGLARNVRVDSFSARFLRARLLPFLLYSFGV